jgi:magnesium-transporting ATPase (P-type)
MVNSHLGFHYKSFRREVPESRFIRKIPYDSDFKLALSAVAHDAGGKNVVRIYARGPSYAIVNACTSQMDPQGAVTPMLRQKRHQTLRAVAAPMGASGLKVIGIAYKEVEVPEHGYFQVYSSSLFVQLSAFGAILRRCFVKQSKTTGCKLQSNLYLRTQLVKKWLYLLQKVLKSRYGFP